MELTDHWKDPERSARCSSASFSSLQPRSPGRRAATRPRGATTQGAAWPSPWSSPAWPTSCSPTPSSSTCPAGCRRARRWCCCRASPRSDWGSPSWPVARGGSQPARRWRCSWWRSGPRTSTWPWRASTSTVSRGAPTPGSGCRSRCCSSPGRCGALRRRRRRPPRAHRRRPRWPWRCPRGGGRTSPRTARAGGPGGRPASRSGRGGARRWRTPSG